MASRTDQMLLVHKEERLAALGRLVTGIAHELRNPLAIIKAAFRPGR